MMTVGQLIEALQDYDEETEVRLMTQQNYPFENGVHGVCDVHEIQRCSDDSCDCGDPDCPDCEDDDSQTTVVYVVEGSQLGYGDKGAWDACNY